MTQSPRRLNVMVLMGGSSSEREISLSTGRMILAALDSSRYEVSAIDTRDLLQLTARAESSGTYLTTEDKEEYERESATEWKGAAGALAASSSPAHTDILSVRPQTADNRPPDLIFIALHGKGGEDGTVQGMLDLMGLPYTGSGVLASALAMNKAMTKRLLHGEGIPVIDEIQVRRGHVPDAAALAGQVGRKLGLPVFVKPNAEGSTVGCALVETTDQLLAAVEMALRHDPLALIERYVRGTEITVGVLGNAGDELEALPVIEIVPRAAFYDFESKYADGGSDHIIPARLPERQLDEAQRIALLCHETLGCRGMSRTDLIATPERLYVLEVNTIPGMTPTSLLPQAAAHAGIPFAALLDRLIQSALPPQETFVGARLRQVVMKEQEETTSA